jgi:threonyl-tRNA synthetase
VRCGPRDYARLAQGAGAVSVRTRGKGDRGSMPLGEFIVKAKGLVESKSAAL